MSAPAESHLNYLLTAYLFESISTEGKREVEGHLAACTACREELARLRRTVGLAGEALRTDGGEAYSFEARRLERVLAERKGRRFLAWLPRKGLYAILATAAALAVISTLFMIPMQMKARGRMDRIPGSSSAAPHLEERVTFGRYAPSPPAPAPGALVLNDKVLVMGGSEAKTEEASREMLFAEKEPATAEPLPPGEPAAVETPAPPPAPEITVAKTGPAKAPTPPSPAFRAPRPAVTATASIPATPPAHPAIVAATPPPAQPPALQPAGGKPESHVLAAGVSVRPQAGESVAGLDFDANGAIDAGLITGDLEVAKAEKADKAPAPKNAQERWSISERSRKPHAPAEGLGAQPGMGSGAPASGPAIAAGDRLDLAMETEKHFEQDVFKIKGDQVKLLQQVNENQKQLIDELSAKLQKLDGSTQGALEGDAPAGAEGRPEKDDIQGWSYGLKVDGKALDARDLYAGGKFKRDGTILEAGGQKHDVFYEDLLGIPDITRQRQNVPLDALVKSQSEVNLDPQLFGKDVQFGGGAVIDLPRYASGRRDPAIQSAVERRLRAFSYWGRIDPTLTLDGFLSRELPVPPPAVGDEGLGEAEFRAKYGVNPFVDARKDPLSTFGMDVDTASYTLARTTLRAGKLPDPKTVRVEDFVNYWKADVPADPAGAPSEGAFSVSCEGGPSPFAEGLDLLEITVKARDLRPGERKPAVLTFAIDASGSMAAPPSPGAPASRLALVGDALRVLVDSLEPDDRVGIVAYAREAYLVLDHTPARERDRILGAIGSIAPGGATDVESGLGLAYRLADEVFEPRAVNRIILCTDGVATAGERGPEEILKKVAVFARRGIWLTCVGVGMGRYDDNLLQTLSKSGNGNYAHVDGAGEAARIFRESLPSTLQVLARDAKIQVEFDPEVVSRYRLVGYEKRDIADKDFRNDAIDSGDVGPGSVVTVLYEVRRRAGAAGDLGKIRLRYHDVGTGRVEETEHPLSPGVIAPSAAETCDRFRFLAAAARTAELLRGSYWARASTFGDVLAVLGSVSPAFRARPEWRELVEMAARARDLTVASFAAK
jgi:Ca-activated chloride channel family protein